jgi:hypothetical protein
MLELNVAVVQNQSFSHKLLQKAPVNRLELEVLLQAVHKLTYILLIVHPVLLVLLNLVLSLAQRFIELFDILRRMQQLTVVRELVKILGDCLIELAGFPHEDLLDAEQVPVFADRLQEIVEEIIEFHS